MIKAVAQYNFTVQNNVMHAFTSSYRRITDRLKRYIAKCKSNNNLTAVELVVVAVIFFFQFFFLSLAFCHWLCVAYPHSHSHTHVWKEKHIATQPLETKGHSNTNSSSDLLELPKEKSLNFICSSLVFYSSISHSCILDKKKKIKSK